MQISPPLGVLGVVAAGLIATAWLAPARHIALVSVDVPVTTYERLAAQTKGRTDQDGMPMTVARLIEQISKNVPQYETDHIRTARERSNCGTGTSLRGPSE
jgi:hypothetical protein